MKLDLNKKLVSTVLKNIPKNKKPVRYLVNILNISRESAYRRMRGDIPFTAQELAILATDLDFSIDSVYEHEKQNRTFIDYSKMGKNSSDFFLFMLSRYSELLEKMSYAKKVEAIMAFNTFSPPFYADFYNLFKFSYYKWLYQDKEISWNKIYSETVLPDEVFVFQKKIINTFIRKKNIVLILDMNIFLNLIREIEYFYNRKLLTNKELIMFKEDMLRLIEKCEEMARTGILGAARIQLYLSPLCVNSNSVYYEYDDNVEPLFWTFTINPVIIQNAEFASIQLKWLNSLKRQSALITQSNEIMQAEFFFQQREYIDKYLAVNADI